MDAFLLSFSYLLMGLVLGAGVDYLFWRKRFQEAAAAVKAQGEAVQQTFEKKLQEKTAALESGNEQLARVEEQLSESRRQADALQEDLAEETRQRQQLAAENSRLPGLENELAQSRQSLEQLGQANDELHEKLAALEREMAAERESLEQCLIYVQGNHYLPGAVVKQLTRKQEEAS